MTRIMTLFQLSILQFIQFNIRSLNHAELHL